LGVGSRLNGHHYHRRDDPHDGERGVTATVNRTS
jgi:hypothetical protein